MMPIVRIPDPIYERLQAIATPFVDSPASAIEKLLDFYEIEHRKERPISPARPHEPEKHVDVNSFKADTPPDLTHTRVVHAQFDGEEALGWNELVHLAHRRAFLQLGSLGALRSATTSNIANGEREDSGFHYLSDINVSIQNVSAQEAWSKALNLAKRLNVPIHVDFEWRQKQGAARPGKNGRLSWIPTTAQPRT